MQKYFVFARHIPVFLLVIHFLEPVVSHSLLSQESNLSFTPVGEGPEGPFMRKTLKLNVQMLFSRLLFPELGSPPFYNFQDSPLNTAVLKPRHCYQ